MTNPYLPDSVRRLIEGADFGRIASAGVDEERERERELLRSAGQEYRSQFEQPEETEATYQYTPPPESVQRLAQIRTELGSADGARQASERSMETGGGLDAPRSRDIVQEQRREQPGQLGALPERDRAMEEAEEARNGRNIRSRIGSILDGLFTKGANRREWGQRIAASSDPDEAEIQRRRGVEQQQQMLRLQHQQLVEQARQQADARDPSSDLNRRYREMYANAGIPVPEDLTVTTPGFENVAGEYLSRAEERRKAERQQAALEDERAYQASLTAEERAYNASLSEQERRAKFDDWLRQQQVSDEMGRDRFLFEAPYRFQRARAAGGANVRDPLPGSAPAGAPQTPVEGVRSALDAQIAEIDWTDTPQDQAARQDLELIARLYNEAASRRDRDTMNDLQSEFREAVSAVRGRRETERQHALPGWRRVEGAPNLEGSERNRVRSTVATYNDLRRIIGEMETLREDMGVGEAAASAAGFPSERMAYATQLWEQASNALRIIGQYGVPQAAELARVSQFAPRFDSVRGYVSGLNAYKALLPAAAGATRAQMAAYGYEPEQELPTHPATRGRREQPSEAREAPRGTPAETPRQAGPQQGRTVVILDNGGNVVARVPEGRVTDMAALRRRASEQGHTLRVE